MRIAVLRPQVPFSAAAPRSSPTSSSDERARGHDADLVSVPFKWYPGARVLTQAFLWRMLDLDEADGRAIDVVVATKFPSYVVRPPGEARVARPPVPPGVRARRHRPRTVRPLARGAGAAPAGAGVDRRSLGEATRLFATSANVAGASGARLRRRGAAAPSVVALPYHTLPSHGFVLSARSARLGQADRPPPRGRGARARLRRRGRIRRARSRLARRLGRRPRA